jgi:hypothetical protein
MAEEKRRSRRYAIAFILGADLGEIEEYQSTRRGSIPVYMTDSGEEFYLALRAGEKLPSKDQWEGSEWERVATSYGYEIYRSKPTV